MSQRAITSIPGIIFMSVHNHQIPLLIRVESNALGLSFKWHSTDKPLLHFVVCFRNEINCNSFRKLCPGLAIASRDTYYELKGNRKPVRLTVLALFIRL